MTTETRLPPEDFDAEVIFGKQKAALENFSARILQHHMELLGLASANDLTSGNYNLFCLITDLYRRLELLTGPADKRRTDPLSYYERNVSPVLRLLQQQPPLPSSGELTSLDMRNNFMGYNWYAAEVANGFDSWRWMGPSRHSGIMIPAVPSLRTIHVYGKYSLPIQDSELKITLNGSLLEIKKRSKEANLAHLEIEVPEKIISETSLNTFPWLVLQFEIETHFVPEEHDTRTLGYGVGLIKVQGI